MAVSDCGNRTSFCFENKYKLHKIENDNLCFVKRSVLHFYGNSLAWFSSILQEMVAASSDANQSGGFVWIAEYIQSVNRRRNSISDRLGLVFSFFNVRSDSDFKNIGLFAIYVLNFFYTN